MSNMSYIPNLFISVAYDSKNGIGKNNSIPWYLPEDLKYFSKLRILLGIYLYIFYYLWFFDTTIIFALKQYQVF